MANGANPAPLQQDKRQAANNKRQRAAEERKAFMDETLATQPETEKTDKNKVWDKMEERGKINAHKMMAAEKRAEKVAQMAESSPVLGLVNAWVSSEQGQQIKSIVQEGGVDKWKPNNLVKACAELLVDEGVGVGEGVAAFTARCEELIVGLALS